MSEKVCTIKEPLATLGDRIIAYIIDFFIMQLGGLLTGVLILIVWGIIAIINTGTEIKDEAYIIGITIAAVIGGLIWIGFNIYYLIFWLVKHEGQSIGKKNRRIRIMIVEDLKNGKIRQINKDDIGVVLLRLVFTLVDALFFFLVGIYLINSDPNRQRFADQQAKTIVISERE